MFANVFAKALRACRLHPMVPAALQFGCSDSSVIANSCLKMLTQHAHNDDYTIDDGHKLGRPSPLSTE
jgi:hypothetical protein